MPNLEKTIALVQGCGKQATRRSGDFYEKTGETARCADRGIQGAVFFLENWDDERGSFLRCLQKTGFNIVWLKAPYHWKVEKEGVSVEYVEGDVYVRVVNANHLS